MTAHRTMTVIAAAAASVSSVDGLWRGFWWQGISLAVMKHA